MKLLRTFFFSVLLIVELVILHALFGYKENEGKMKEPKTISL